jgi:hypothetical protein
MRPSVHALEEVDCVKITVLPEQNVSGEIIADVHTLLMGQSITPPPSYLALTKWTNNRTHRIYKDTFPHLNLKSIIALNPWIYMTKNYTVKFESELGTSWTPVQYQALLSCWLIFLTFILLRRIYN